MPERTREVEGGFDLGLFKDRSDLSFTVYRRTSLDVILPIPVAASSGAQLQVKNGAKIQNQGAELSLNVRPVITKDLTWSVGVLGGINRNEVLDLSGANFVPYGDNGGFLISYAQLSGSIGTFRDYDYVRCGNGVTLTDGVGGTYDVDANCTSAQKSKHALFINGDVNGGPLVNASGDAGLGTGYPLLDPTQRIMGSPDPKWTGSLSTSVRYKHWSFSGLLDVRHGGLIWNGTREVLNAFGTSIESARRGQTVVFGKDFLDGATAGPGAGTPVELTQDFFQNYYSGHLAAHHRRAILRGRRLHQAAGDLGGIRVHRSVGATGVGAFDDRSARGGSQPGHVEQVQRCRPGSELAGFRDGSARDRLLQQSADALVRAHALAQSLRPIPCHSPD